MYGTGSKLCSAALFTWLAALICVPGCQSGGGQASFANPFMSQDRVPPPATRAVAPGSAQPYYPGDPVPVLQGAAPMPQPTLAAPSAAPQPITPITAAPVPAQTYVSAPAGYATVPATIPPDQQFNQFAQPPAPVNAAPTVAMNNFVQPAVFNQPISGNNYASQAGFANGQQQQAEVADTGFSQPALPAAADPRVVLESQVPVGQPANQPPAEEQVPWRSPAAGNPGTGVNNYQPVQLQAIPSTYPQEAAGFNSAPRIRIPSSTQPGFDNQMQSVNYTAPLPAMPQTVAITELPSYPPGVAVAPPLVAPSQPTSPWQGTPAPPAATATYYGGPNDGFRPRTSMR